MGNSKWRQAAIVDFYFNIKEVKIVKHVVLRSQMPNLMQFTKGCIIFGGIWDIFRKNGKLKMASGGHIGFLFWY